MFEMIFTLDLIENRRKKSTTRLKLLPPMSRPNTVQTWWRWLLWFAKPLPIHSGANNTVQSSDSMNSIVSRKPCN